MKLASILIGVCLVGLFISQSPARAGHFQEKAAEPPQATGEVRAGDEQALRPSSPSSPEHSTLARSKPWPLCSRAMPGWSR